MLGFLDGAIPCPSFDPNDPESASDFEYWQCQDKFIQQLMYSSITEELVNQLVG